MATTKPKQTDELYVAITDFRRDGELIQAGWTFLGGDPLVSGNPELLTPFAAGRRGIVAARAELERAELEEGARQAQAKAAEQEEEPPRPPKVVALRSFQHRGNEVPIGSVWLKNHDVVRSAPTAFADVQD